MIILLFLDGIYGSLAGLVWAYVLGLPLKRGLICGFILGMLSGIAQFILNKAINNKRPALFTESGFIAISQTVSILGGIITLAFLTWVFRLFFM